MEKLVNPVMTVAVLNRHGFNFKKKYGQNFLIDKNILEKIIDAARITEEDLVLEIGPGIGTMTQFLCEKAGKVVAVEIDEKLIPVLSETLAEYDNVEVINDDILKLDINKIADGSYAGNADSEGENAEGKADSPKKIKVVANLPYYITTPIVMELLSTKLNLSSITVMVQKEVADRMQAQPGGKDYGALSLAINYYCVPEVVTVVSPSCFMPPPKVSSEVINLKVREKPAVEAKDEEHMFMCIRAAFNQRRKTLANAVSNFTKLNASREQVCAALEKMGLDSRIRGEALSLEQFAEFSNLLMQ